MISVHDLHNSILSLGLIINDLDDPQVIKDKFKIHAKEFGVDLNQFDFTHMEDVRNYGEKMEKKIEIFTKAKQTKYQNKIEIDLELFYFEDCERLSDQQLLLKWYGIMLDNALEASDNHPIFIYLASTSKSLTLRLANEYTGTKDEVKKFFEKGYSTKGEARGLGLYNLKQQVVELGGEIEVDVYDDNNRNCQFIEISIEFEREDAQN
jgi:K+-sensing histidine kinase KdpD